MKPADDILFASIDCLPELDKEKATNEILPLVEKYTWYDDYRHTTMVPLMTKDGLIGRSGASNLREGEFVWTSFAPQVIVDWFENHVFTWLGMKARISALVTKPNVAMNEHLDCNRIELNSLQHKFRVVTQGETDTLYWLTDKGKVFAPSTDKPFLIDGGWPHGMVNTTDDIKVTLALGAPWNGKDNYGNDLTILQRRSDYKMPENMDHLWGDNR